MRHHRRHDYGDVMTYRWLWRHLPGNIWTKTPIALGIFVSYIALLFVIVFPFASRLGSDYDSIIEPSYTPTEDVED